MEMPGDTGAELDLAFSLTEGGPGTAFMKRLRLIHPELGAGSARTALILMALTWVPLCVLCLIEGLAFSGVKLPFFYDIAAHTRFLLAVPVLVLADIPYNQEIVFVVSMAVVCAMLVRVVHDLDEATKRTILYAAIIIFIYRATPLTGQGYTWFAIDVLGFDEAFQGTLGQIGAGLALLGMWLFSDAITRRPVPTVLLWLTIVTTLLSLPALGLVLGLADWTERVFGFGARTIAIIDTAATSPFAQLSMIPLLTLCAIYAPKGHRATWFALMASLMNLALVAGQLQTKYLNEIYVVGRGNYENLPYIVAWSLAIGFLVPLAAIFAFGRRLE